MILSEFFNVSPDRMDKIKAAISSLVKELKERGYEVDTFPININEIDAELCADDKEGERCSSVISREALECLHVSKVFEQADDYDLIHNHSGLAPLGFSGLVDAPLLSTIYEPLKGDILKMYKKYSKSTFYVFDTSVENIYDLDCITKIDHGLSDEEFDPKYMVESYIDIYQSIIAGNHKGGTRPWGHYSILSEGEDQKTKLVHVKRKRRLSLQRHRKRREHWTILKGEALVTLNKDEIKLIVGETIEIPDHAVHRIENIGNEELIFFEIQKGDYLGEDDIERLEDDYARS